MITLYDLVPLRTVSWCMKTGEPTDWQYANSSRPSRNECLEEIPSNAIADHPAVNATQQQFGAVVAIIDADEDHGLTAVVAVDFENTQEER